MTDESTMKSVPEKTRLVIEHKHSRPLTSCHWDPFQRYVFFGAEDNHVHRFDPAAKTAIPMEAHSSWVRAFGSSADAKWLYTGGYDGRLVWWSATAEQPEPVRVVDAHQGWIRSLAVSPDGQQIATCGNDGLVKLWDAAQGTLIRELAGHNSHVYNVVFTPDNASIISCDLKGVVRSWNRTDEAAGKDLATITALHKFDETFRADIGGARSIAVGSDGGQVGLGGITNVSNAFAGVGEVVVVLLELATSKVLQQLETKAKTRGTAWGVDWHPDGFWIGCSGGGGGGWLNFWKGDTQHEFFSMKLKSDGRGMSLSKSGTQVAVAHSDTHLRIYDLHPE